MATYTVTGRGIQPLNTNLAGLHVRQLATSLDATIGNANPANYFHAGLLRLGNSYGWRETRPVDAIDMWLDVPSGTTRIGYEVGSGGQISIEEVVAPAVPNSSLMPWDRAPLPTISGAQGTIAGNTALTTSFTYTVPAGRILALCDAEVEASRQAAATGVGVTYGYILVNDVAVLWLAYFSNTLGETNRAAHAGGPLMIPAAGTVKGQWQNADVGGSVYVALRASGYLFNA
jgi:hypothetical protein